MELRSDKVILHDASACFSEDEWTLLQNWEKELYKNVMKEIDQALRSLGSVITSMVFSVRAKEKQKLCPIDTLQFERRQNINASPSSNLTSTAFSLSAKENDKLAPVDNKPAESNHHHVYSSNHMMAKPDTLLKLNNKETLHLNILQEPEAIQRSDCRRAGNERFQHFRSDVPSRKGEELVSVFQGHLSAEIRESSTDPTSGQEVASLCIKEEEDTYNVDYQNGKSLETSTCLQDDGRINSQRNAGEHIQYTKTTTPYEVSSEATTSKAQQSWQTETNSRCQLWSEHSWEMRRGRINSIQSGFSNSEHSSSYPGWTKESISQRYKGKSNLRNSPFHHNLSSMQHNQMLYTCTECGKSYSLKGELVKHMQSHSRVRRYACSDCGKSFFWKANLTTHQSTHTGDKPYACSFCHKTFSRKGNLQGHIRIHTGERPYKCTECGKRFTWKCNLKKHQLSH
ncbi:zinc finger protein 432-like isoform X2 [Ambystoma mexicanum]|uniref:zinc finger protein 432-like isoform X2 n=1 Tax=Ambystoma mexicanum TaxID=8296 RepID=UPI0037E8CDC5